MEMFVPELYFEQKMVDKNDHQQTPSMNHNLCLHTKFKKNPQLSWAKRNDNENLKFKSHYSTMYILAIKFNKKFFNL